MMDQNLLFYQRPASKDEVFEKAQDLKAVLITNDKGFGDIRRYPPSSHSGVIVLKMATELADIQKVHESLKELLRKERQFQGILFIVDTHKYRIRRNP